MERITPAVHGQNLLASLDVTRDDEEGTVRLNQLIAAKHRIVPLDVLDIGQEMRTRVVHPARCTKVSRNDPNRTRVRV